MAAVRLSTRMLELSARAPTCDVLAAQLAGLMSAAELAAHAELHRELSDRRRKILERADQLEDLVEELTNENIGLRAELRARDQADRRATGGRAA